jgi:hypothetical protein
MNTHPNILNMTRLVIMRMEPLLYLPAGAGAGAGAGNLGTQYYFPVRAVPCPEPTRRAKTRQQKKPYCVPRIPPYCVPRIPRAAALAHLHDLPRRVVVIIVGRVGGGGIGAEEFADAPVLAVVAVGGDVDVLRVLAGDFPLVVAVVHPHGH